LSTVEERLIRRGGGGGEGGGVKNGRERCERI